MDLSMDRDIPDVFPRVGPARNNFTAQNQAPAIANITIPHESPNIQHFSLSDQTIAAGSTSEESTEDELSSFSYINVEVHYTLLLIIMVSSVAINGLVFVLFYQRPSVRMTSNKFVLNMAIVHLLQTFIVLPFVFVSVMFQGWIFGDVFCKIHGTVSMCLTMANVFSILLIAVDRNCAVNSPLHYSMTITKKRTSVLIVSTWLCALVVSVPPLVGVSGLQYQKSWAMCTVTWYDTGVLTLAYACVLSVLGFLMPFIRITWIYASMFQAARRNSACTRLRNVKSGSNELSPPSSAGPYGGSHRPVYFPRKPAWSKRTSSPSKASSLFGDKLKAVRTAVLVVVSFTACFLPFFAMTLAETQRANASETPLRNLPAIAMLLLFSSSLINPYLYVIRNKVTRKHVRKMFTGLTRKPSIFSPLGYHYSHQSPLRERKCSDGTRVPESTASLRSGESEECQRFMRRSLYRNKSGEWNMVAVTIEPNLSPARRSSIVVHRPLCLDEMGEQLEQLFQQEYSHHHYTYRPMCYGMAARNRSCRRASLDNPKVPPERFSRNCERYVKPTSMNLSTRSKADRSKSFRIRGRYANRREPTAACDMSCKSNVNHEEWCHNLINSCTPRLASNATQESRSSVSVLAGGAETSQAVPHSATSMGHVQRCGSVPLEYHSSATAGHPSRPELKRGWSFAFEEREVSVVIPAQAISQFGRFRKSQFAMAKRSRKQSSSDTNTTTLESLTSTESQEVPMIGSPRTLSPTSSQSYHYPPPQTCQHHQQLRWRLHGYSSMPLPATFLSQQQQQQHIQLSGECHDRRDSGFEDTMLERCDLCDTVVNASDSMKTMTFIEHV
ncbi:uncharacterized protein [Dermacentor albipictus]|uniref:uncharacterized protein n=1 Tax=Dermacentor albipictus TaxID=60249 RepID=UPI0031FC2365